jgi:DNA repair exonuclease SbcCD nuclease subunit
MRIAVLSDTHLGYARFEADSYAQAERAVLGASSKADLILCAGDVFDTKIPKLETLKKGVEIFRSAKVPVFAIHGNHERRAKDLTNPVQLLAAGSGITLLHGQWGVFEKDEEKVRVFGLGSVPEEYARTALEKTLGDFKKDGSSFTILLIHQSIRELVPGGKDELSLEYLEGLPFDLIVNGHIHETISRLGGRFLIPGSTVITQLKKDETAPKGYYIYDTKARKAEFIAIDSRPFFYEELEFKDANDSDVREAVREKVRGLKSKNPDAIIALKLDGTLKAGLSSSDIKPGDFGDVYIDNRLNSENLGARLQRIRTSREESLTLRDMALRELKERTEGKLTLFDSTELFDKLLQGPDEALEYLEKHNKKDSK